MGLIYKPRSIFVEDFRDVRRPESLRQLNFDNQYDFHTLAYDSFQMNGSGFLVCPPLLNFEEKLSSIVSIEVSKVYKFDRNDLVVTKVVPTVSAGAFVENINMNHYFENCNVLMTLQKNNDLSWIKFWIEFHVLNLGVDAVVLYDNGSTKYNSSDLFSLLTSIDSLKFFVIVEWDFPYGPGAMKVDNTEVSRWDSDYCQYGALMHARHFFVNSSNVLINLDVDELVLNTNGPINLTDYEKNGFAGIEFSGEFVSCVNELLYDDHRNYHMTYLNKLISRPKYCYFPSKLSIWNQPMVHNVGGVHLEDNSEFKFFHFKGINTNWKEGRSIKEVFDASRHIKSDVLFERFNRF